MGRSERWTVALIGVVGLGFLVATGREGGELVFDHAAGMTTAAMEAEIKNRAAGHQHEEGEEDADTSTPRPAPTDSMPEHAGTLTPRAADSAAAPPAHTHAPGTPPHKD